VRGTLAVIDDLRIQQLVLAKWDHYKPAMPHVSVQFLDRESFLDVAREDPRIADELAIGWFEDFEAQFRDPVLTDVAREIVTVCPPIMRDVVEPEPPRIQRAYVEGAFLRRMFRLLVDGKGWEADAQVRAVMARHFPFHLASVEAVEGSLQT
jgi:hypothetical protein